MVGHRTRLIQENLMHWHDNEDKTIEQYLQLTAAQNRVEARLISLAPYGWLMIGLAGLIGGLFLNTASPVRLALSIGGILFAFQAFSDLANSLHFLLQAILGWDQVQLLLEASTRPSDSQFLTLASDQEDAWQAQALLVAHDLVFRYADQLQPVLQNCSLRIDAGDRLLLEGPSGGGKSTLAAVLASLYTPEAGMLLYKGFDRQVLGTDQWRRRILVAPQFQENHVFTETFGFNLLMGRRWPPLPEDLAEAETVCRQLGLGYLLDQMPEKFDQRVGESGWRLSHGECSRLYIGRALLQKPDLLILDESFGALDPASLQLAMQCVLNRAATLLVIAHP
jgi:ATP-binding cassette subfamily B protein